MGFTPGFNTDFNPRAPYGARPVNGVYPGFQHRFQSSRPIRGATTDNTVNPQLFIISILAPHTGRDLKEFSDSRRDQTAFQSSRPIRGATGRRNKQGVSSRFQSSRPIRGATAGLERYLYLRLFQSSRPIRGATFALSRPCGNDVFQSSRPIRGATGVKVLLRYFLTNFNPRAPYGARRRIIVITGAPGTDFNPRAPYGARQQSRGLSTRVSIFQSSRPIRGATLCFPAAD